MATKQGSVALLQDPVAQELLHAPIPARLAYTWKDGTPRVVPIGFHWNGTELVLGTPPDAPKMKVLKDGTKVALTIDHERWPSKVLLIRGTVRTDTVEGIASEYVEMCRRTMGEEQAKAWVAQAGPILPRMTRVFIRPEWVGIIDFQTRFPNALERAMERAMAQAAP
jgi:hypothetical protein